ncbi:hypothetical protein LUZ60_012626 [Juncus effusus]|nr:hypothetical protein LUZ60_012626 [Juncus effusus]
MVLMESELESVLLCNNGDNNKNSQRKASYVIIRRFMANLHEVFLSTKLFPLFSAVPLAIAAQSCGFGSAWVFAFSLIGLAPLAERVSFLSEQIADTAGTTVGGLLNATCGNAPELIIALLALQNDKIEVLKWSLLGSILSNLLLVLGSSFLFGGLSNFSKERPFHRKQVDMSMSLLLLGVTCHISALILNQKNKSENNSSASSSVLIFSRSCGILMLVAYFGFLFFQLKSHRETTFQNQEEEELEEEGSIIGFTSASIWLITMTILIAILSEYIVSTIEDASESWGVSVRFISIILLPIVGNAAEHAGAIIFASKNKIDLVLGVALGSATQISMFVMPVILIVAWIKGVKMDLDFSLLETATLSLSILLTAFTLQDVKWHYMKGFVLVLCYLVISACFLIQKD